MTWKVQIRSTSNKWIDASSEWATKEQAQWAADGLAKHTGNVTRTRCQDCNGDGLVRTLDCDDASKAIRCGCQ